MSIKHPSIKIKERIFMLELKYLNCKTSYEVEFFRVSENVIELHGDFPIKSCGFTLSRPSQDQDDDWDYSDFTTIYRTLENGVQFSNDESIYIEPTPTLPNIPLEPYEPTPEELETIFQQNKVNKIALSKTMLAEYLENNPLHSSAHGGVEGIYSVTSEKQSLMMSQYMTYQIAKSVDPDAKLTWNETGKSCTEWAEEEFLQLILEVKAYVYPLVSHQQQIEEQITNCESQEELDEIVINYNIVNLEK